MLRVLLLAPVCCERMCVLVATCVCCVMFGLRVGSIRLRLAQVTTQTHVVTGTARSRVHVISHGVWTEGGLGVADVVFARNQRKPTKFILPRAAGLVESS